MRYLLIAILSLSAYSNEAFLVSFKGSKTIVESQSEKNEFIGLVLKNETFKRLRGEIRSEKGVIRRYSLKGGGSASFQIKHSEYKKLSVVNLSPAIDDIKLKVGKKKYEIP